MGQKRIKSAHEGFIRKGGSAVRRSFDYHTYRGRGTVSDWLKRIALVLAILVVLAVAFLLWVQPYVSYTDNGVQVNLPFFQHEAKQPDASNIHVEDNEPGSDVSQQEGDGQGDDSQQGTPQQTSSRTIVEVPLSALLDGSAAQLVQQQGGDSVIVEMKNDQGELGWSSQQALAGSVQSAAQDEQVNQKLQSWNAGDVYTVARISCFRDEAVGRQMDYTLRTKSGYRWMDDAGDHWSDPSNQQVQDYLVGLMTELAQLGFDEIVLDHCAYPTQTDGSLGNIRYASQTADQVVNAFLAKAAQALEPYGTKLSLAVSAEQAAGQEGDSGLTAQSMEQYAQRLWVAGEEQALLSTLTAAGITSPQERLVLRTQTFQSNLSVSQALWS